jgi:hypothetical protein
MVMGPEGNLYFSMLRITPEGAVPEFRAIDTRNDNQDVFTLTTEDLSSGFFGTNALVDADGNIYVSGESQLQKLTATGERIWTIGVPGLPRSLQFGPDGNVVFFTWNGWFQSVDPITADVTRQNLTPNREYGNSSAPCFTDDISECAYIDARPSTPSRASSTPPTPRVPATAGSRHGATMPPPTASRCRGPLTSSTVT